ncbi:MAG: FAD:protein FMN transferase [Bacteroidales bacterium]|nr:FAD:protein FMN transferase [Bacteroidales bacterium]MCF8457646.1 FAD:protein FMN transferase [Bacteroidales bacterium]
MKNTIILSLLALTFASCNTQKLDYYTIHGFTQGTTFSIIYEGKKDYTHQIDSILQVFDLSLSGYNTESVITKVNQNDPNVVVDQYFSDFYQKSKEIWEATHGAFDITVAPIVNAWGFGFGDSANISQHLIDSLLLYVGMEKTGLENGKISKHDPAIKFDSNAIAQGQSVDVVGDFLEARSIVNYLVEIGGEVKARGINAKSETWRIGVDKAIDDPDASDRELQAIVHLKNRALATSGNYRKFYIKNGIKYSHTIDPKTGYPVNHSLLSATVLAPDCITADGYATSFMVMGFEKTQEFVAAHPELSVYLIADNGKGGLKIFISDNLKEFIEEL